MKTIAALCSYLVASLTTTFIFLPDAYADVNMMEAGYQTSFIDMTVAGLRISRRYNSRSNFTGVFGFGWCSTFDTHLEFSTTPQGRVFSAINDCGRLNNVGQSNAVSYSNGFYKQTLSSGLERLYDAETGELVRLRAPGQPAVGVTRNRLLRDAALGEGLKMRPGLMIRLEFNDLGENVIALETSDDQHAQFTYSADRNLLSAKNAWSNTYRFSYDALHNLTRVAYPDHTFDQITYDIDHDQLTSFTGRDGCTENYSFSTSGSENKRHQVSTAHLLCHSQVKREIHFEFDFEKRQNQWRLTNFKTTRGAK